MLSEQPHILIIDDDEQICDLLQTFLQQQGWTISSANNTTEAETVLEVFKPDVIILDVMMPGETGLDFLQRYRTVSDVPVLMLTAAAELDDKVAGLLAGADDYLAKPFEPEEFLLRIKAILRRTKPESIAPSKIKIGYMEFDLERGILTQNDSVLKLTEGESALLNILATNPGKIFSREELANRSKIDGDDRAVDVQITRLRKKMESNPKNIYDNRWQALTVISIIQLILMLDATVVNVALPQIKYDFGLTDSSLTWIVNAYLIMAGSLLLLGGKLGDTFGVLRLFKIGIIIFAFFSLVATIAPSVDILILGRAGQGVGEAFVAANGLAMVSLLFPNGTERTKAFSIWAGMAGLGAIIGVLLSGILTEYLSWRWIFGINVPIIFVLSVATIIFIPKLSNKILTRLDLGNTIALALAVSTIVFGIIGTGIETSYLLRFALFIIGLVVIVIVIRRCKKSQNGIIPQRLMTRSPRLYGYAIIAIQASTSGALFYLGILLLQGPLEMSPMQAGLAWLPFCLGFFPGLFLSQSLSQNKSLRVAVLVGLIISVIGFIMLALSVLIQNYWLGMMPAMLVTSIGGGCLAPVSQSLATADLSEDDSGVGAGISNTIQQLLQVGGVTAGVSIGIAVTSDENMFTIGTYGFITSFLLCAFIFLVGVGLFCSKRSISVLNLSQSVHKN